MTAGSVDDGKSTLVGRLLHDTHSIPEDQLQAVKKASLRLGQHEIDYSLVTDGLQAEREQGITIDVAYRYFGYGGRRFILADTPGHEQYTRNMATAASTAELALLLVDAEKGLLPQTHRHAAIASLFGVRHFIVAINKMDLVGFSHDRFRRIEFALSRFSDSLEHPYVQCIPTSALQGDNVTQGSPRMPWYAGPTVLEALGDANPTLETPGPLRMTVQAVLRVPEGGRRYAGRVVGGRLRIGDEVCAFPSGTVSTVAAIHCGWAPLAEADTGLSVAVTLADECDIGRGSLLTAAAEPPRSASHLAAKLVWMAEEPAELERRYLLQHASGTTPVRIGSVRGALDPATLEWLAADAIGQNDVVEVSLTTGAPLWHDRYDLNRTMGSFIVVDPESNATVAGGMITGQGGPAPRRRPRDAAAGKGMIVWLTGLSSSGKSTLAKMVSDRLAVLGYGTEWLDGDVMREKFGRELGFSRADRNENIRRIGYVAHLLAHCGAIVVVSAIAPYRDLREEVRGQAPRFIEVFVDAPLEVCQRRDVKGLYARARAGELQQLTGVDDPYEPPLAPEVTCHTAEESVSESAAKILAAVLAAISPDRQSASAGRAR